MTPTTRRRAFDRAAKANRPYYVAAARLAVACEDALAAMAEFDRLDLSKYRPRFPGDEFAEEVGFLVDGLHFTLSIVAGSLPGWLPAVPGRDQDEDDNEPHYPAIAQVARLQRAGQPVPEDLLITARKELAEALGD